MLKRDKNGKWSATEIPNDFNPVYAKSLVEFLNTLDPLFAKAQEKSDFEFIFALLNIQAQDVSWNAFDTTQDIFETFTKLRAKIKYNNKMTIFTFQI